MHITEIQHDSNAEIPYHVHDSSQLLIVKSGVSKVQVENGWWLVMPETGLYIPPKIPHRAIYAKDANIVRILFNSKNPSTLSHVSLITFSSLTNALIEEIIRLKNQEYTLEVFNQLELIYQLLHYQVKDNLKKDNLYISDGYDKRLKYITNKLKNNPCCLDSLYQLAKEANSSLRTINRLFEKETGLTFSQWRHHLRMMIAIEKLLQGNSITKIAFEVGYQSSNSFSTAFHKYMGQPPQKYLLNYKPT